MKQIIVLLIFITTFGCAGSGRNPGGESAISDDDSILVASGYEVVELAKLRTGHITATFMVNGKPCVFLVDTGGGATLIDYTKKILPHTGRAMEHMASFDYGYKIAAVRDWLFRQCK